MIIGVPKEIKDQEYRVALLPSAAYQLIQRGHQVLVERNTMPRRTRRRTLW
jgi:alanine dehydrogenase